MDTIPLLIEPQQLRDLQVRPNVLVVDLCKTEVYAQGHIPDAVHFEYKNLVLGERPIPGLLPPAESLQAALSAIGLLPTDHVVAYDEEGGGKACRFLWTLDVIGHPRGSLLNGGIIAWAREGRPLSQEMVPTNTTSYSVSYDDADRVLATKEMILENLNNNQFQLLDARTADEFNGVSVRAAKGGHIPGAINLNWLDTMDRQGDARLLTTGTLHDMLQKCGLTPEKDTVCYCQTNHRSAHSYVMLKHLGFDRVKAYAGSWSEWGNDPDTPVER